MPAEVERPIYYVGGPYDGRICQKPTVTNEAIAVRLENGRIVYGRYLRLKNEKDYGQMLIYMGMV